MSIASTWCCNYTWLRKQKPFSALALALALACENPGYTMPSLQWCTDQKSTSSYTCIHRLSQHAIGLSFCIFKHFNKQTQIQQLKITKSNEFQFQNRFTKKNYYYYYLNLIVQQVWNLMREWFRQAYLQNGYTFLLLLVGVFMGNGLFHTMCHSC